MELIISIVIISAGAAILEIPSFLKQRLYKELYIFVGLLIFSLAVGIMRGLEVDIPNPFDWLTYIFEPMTKMIQRFMND